MSSAAIAQCSAERLLLSVSNLNGLSARIRERGRCMVQRRLMRGLYYTIAQMSILSMTASSGTTSLFLMSQCMGSMMSLVGLEAASYYLFSGWVEISCCYLGISASSSSSGLTLLGDWQLIPEMLSLMILFRSFSSSDIQQLQMFTYRNLPLLFKIKRVATTPQTQTNPIYISTINLFSQPEKITTIQDKTIILIEPRIIDQFRYIMRRQQIELLQHVEKIEKNQIYLMENPKTPQQQFLHLFAHRHLLKEKMIHKNVDRSLNQLEGSFAQSSLKLAYITLCIQNQIEVAEGISQLLDLIHGWVQYYPTIDRNGKILLTEIILQDKTSIEDISGYDVYLHYLNLISTDLWKLLKKTKNNDLFFAERSFKDQYNQWLQMDLKHLDAVDLLTFVSSCLPKVLLNIILQKQSLPAEMRQKFAKFQCLYSNQGIQYYLRTNVKLTLLLKQMFLALFAMELNASQQKFLMLLAMKYYYVFHFDRRHSAPQTFVFAFNKLTEEVRQSLKDQFVLFIKIIQKLGKVKFMAFLEKNSVLLKDLVNQARKKPIVGYSQDTAAPYNTIGVGQTINLERGATTCRYFQILEQFSIFYYRIVVKSLDITVRLYYMGEIGSQKQAKTLLLTQQKRSGEIKNCVNAMKKGIYMFEFDNTYSWINGKTLKYENVIYAPLEIKSIDCDEWIEDFYENIYQNIIAQQQDIYIVEKKLAPKQPQTDNKANIYKKEGNISLVISKPNQLYEYQTDNPERMEQKIVSINKSKEQLFWTIENKPVAYHSDIQNYLRGVKVQKQSLPPKPAPQIVEKYQQSDQEEEVSAEEYEVVQRQLEQSQIFNQGTLTEASTRISQSDVSKPEEQRKKSNSSKQQILCNAEQAAQFYGQDQK